MRQISSHEIGARQVGRGKISFRQVGPLQVHSAQIHPPQVAAVHIQSHSATVGFEAFWPPYGEVVGCATQIGARQVRILEVYRSQLRSTQVGTPEARVPEVGTQKVGAPQVFTPEIHSPKVRSKCPRALEVASPQSGPSQQVFSLERREPQTPPDECATEKRDSDAGGDQAIWPLCGKSPRLSFPLAHHRHPQPPTRRYAPGSERSCRRRAVPLMRTRR
jgi:hypothetical protein